MVYYSAFRSGKPVRDDDLAELCNGSTADSDSVCEGSNPSSAAMVYSLNRSAPEKRRNSPFFCVFRRFSHFSQTNKMSEIKRSGGQFSGGRKDSNAF